MAEACIQKKAMAEANLPEEIIVNIISRLPVKSLLRFTAVSKRWRSLILFDKQFENELRRNKTLTHRLLMCSWPPQLESLELETTSFRKLNFPFDLAGGTVQLLGSCNGLVFAFVTNRKVFYVFNPLTGFVKELPSTDYYFRNVRLHDYGVILSANGVGYLPATDEYKVIVSYTIRNNEEDDEEDDEENGLSFDDDDEEEEEEEEEKNCLSFKEEEEEKKKNGISFEEEEEKNCLSFKKEEEEKKKKNGLSFKEEEDKNCLSFKQEEEEKKKNGLSFEDEDEEDEDEDEDEDDEDEDEEEGDEEGEDEDEEEKQKKKKKYSLSFEIISLKDQKWRSIKGPADSHLCGQRGTLVNEALHWLNGPKPREPYEIVAFDFAKEEFRKMQLPNYAQDGKDFSYLGVCSGGCLCVSRYPFDDCDSIDFWVMTEYQVSESWTKLFSLRFSNPEHVWPLRALLITENCTVAMICYGNLSTKIRISHKQEEGEEEPSFDLFPDAHWSGVIECEESLVSIGGYNGVENPSQGCTKLK